MSIDKIAETLGVRSLKEALADESNEIEITTDDPEESGDDIVVYENETALEPGKDLAYEVISDIELARKNIHHLIERGTAGFDDLIALAKTSESPRAFESATLMMAELIKANKEFIDVSERKRLAQEEVGAGPKETQAITQNNLIVTTNDLLDSLLSRAKGNS